jgi:hypothetical protein
LPDAVLRYRFVMGRRRRVPVPCTYCGKVALPTGDHVISRAVRKEYHMRGPVFRRIGDGPGKHDGETLAIKVPVCVECNGGWMSRLEEVLAPDLGKALRNQGPVFLDPIRQSQIATWAIKMALGLQVNAATLDAHAAALTLPADEPPPPLAAIVPEDNFRWLATREQPPPGTRVWMGCVNAEGKNVAPNAGVTFFDEEVHPVAYLLTFSLGCALFQVFGHEVFHEDGTPRRDLRALEPLERLRNALIEVWPGNACAVSWPPPEHLPWYRRREVASWPAELGLPTHPDWPVA